jgi:magnesium transporter
MIQIYTSAGMETQGGFLQACSDVEKGAWVSLVEPHADDLKRISEQLHVDYLLLQNLNDGEEKARVEYDDDHTLIIIDIPIVEIKEDQPIFYTVPLVIMIVRETILTMCVKDSPILEEFRVFKQKKLRTDKPFHFALQLLLKTSSYYIKFLKHIDRRTTEIEQAVRQSTTTQELFDVLDLEKTLVYFNLGLKGNQSVARKLVTSREIAGNEEYREIIEDVIIEYEQALEMTQTYSHILASISNAFASIASQKLNVVIKFLTSLTIVLLIPSIIAGFYGMNVPLPLAEEPHAFTIIVLMTITLVSFTLWIFHRRKWL